MLNFFRKNQRIFFIAITAMIIVSFSFFGTYNSVGSPQGKDGVAFHAINGKKIRRSELQRMVSFISSDSIDKLQYGGVPGPNFLNNGVVRKDILENRLGPLLYAQYSDLLKADMKVRIDREKRFTLYSHPQASFLSTEAIWSHYAPRLREGMQEWGILQDPYSEEAFELRAKCYLAEQEFPQPMLKQVLRYQEAQHEWLSPDPHLEQRDLALFGYHSLEDWFGPRFLNLVGEFIINASLLAEEQGYVVTKDEVWTDLSLNAERSYQLNQNSPYMEARSPKSYLEHQLKLMGMDRSTAIKTWKRVLLFRRLFHDAGDAVLIDNFAFQKLQEEVGATAEAKVYALPDSMRLKDANDLYALEVYLDAVANRSDLLSLPETTKTVAQLKRTTPELVHRHYKLRVAQVPRETLRVRVPLKEMWNWQLEDNNWKKLAVQFPALGNSKAKDREERFTALKNLDRMTRSRVNKVAQDAIVNAHPEWLEEAFAAADTEDVELPLKGIKNQEALKAELARAEVGSTRDYSESTERLFKVTVLEKGEQEEILSFGDALKKKVLYPLVEAKLDAHYKTIRAASPEKYQRKDGTWKQLKSVRHEVAADLFAPILIEVHEEMAAHGGATAQLPEEPSAEYAAAHRFHRVLRARREQLMAGQDENTLWPLEERTISIGREEAFEYGMALEAMTPGTWGDVVDGPDRSPCVYQITGTQAGTIESGAMDRARQALSIEAQQHLMLQVLAEIEARGGLSLSWLDANDEEEV